MITAVAVAVCLAESQFRSVALPNPLPMRSGPLLISDDGKYMFDYNSGAERISLATGLSEAAEPIQVIISASTPPTVFSRTMSQAHWHPIELAESNFLGGYTTGLVQLWADAPSGNRLLVLTRPSGVEDLWAVTDVHFDERTENPNRSWLLKVPRGCWPQAGRLSENDKTVEVWVAEPGGLARYSANQRKPESYLKTTSVLPFRNSRLYGGSMPNTYDPLTQTLTLRESDQSLIFVDARGRLIRRYRPRDGEPAARGLWEMCVPDRSVPGGKSKWEAIACSATRQYWLLRNRSKGDYKLFRLRH